MVRAGHREARPVFSLVMWVCRRTSASDRKLRSFVRSLFRCCTARAPPPAPAAASRTYPRSPRCLVSRLASWYSCASPHWCYKYAIRSLTPSLSLSLSLSRTHTNDRLLACWLALEPRRRRHILPSASTSTCLRRTRRRSSKLPRSSVSMWLSLRVASAVAVRPSHGTDQVRRRLLQTKQSRTWIFGG
mgnify:CR=1 FL=1